MEIKVVKLRNGAEEAAPVVSAVMMSIWQIWKEGLKGMLSIYELNKLCKNSNHKIFSDDYAKLLVSYGLLNEATHSPHDSICNVVVSAFREGKEIYDFSIGSPIAEELELMEVDQLVDEL